MMGGTIDRWWEVSLERAVSASACPTVTSSHCNLQKQLAALEVPLLWENQSGQD